MMPSFSYANVAAFPQQASSSPSSSSSPGIAAATVLQLPVHNDKVQLVLNCRPTAAAIPSVAAASKPVPIAIPAAAPAAVSLEIFPSPPIDAADAVVLMQNRHLPHHHRPSATTALSAALMPAPMTTAPTATEATAAVALALMSSSVSSTGSSAHSCSSPSPPLPQQQQQPMAAEARPLQQLQLQQLNKPQRLVRQQLERRLSEGSSHCTPRSSRLTSRVSLEEFTPTAQPQQPQQSGLPPHHPALGNRKSIPSSTAVGPATLTKDQRRCDKCGEEMSSKCIMQTCGAGGERAATDPQVRCRRCGNELTTKCILSMC